jgi:23S rRNA pseudouridine1911/1915/1917 synthase
MLEVLYEDNHLIAVNKPAGMLVQGDQTGDKCLIDYVKSYIREKYNKPGNVYCGLIHRIDRPVSGVVLLAKTSKALTRMNKQFQERKPKKKYWAIVEGAAKQDSDLLENYLKRNQKQNKSYVVESNVKESKLAKLKFEQIKKLDNYSLLEIELLTGRHHQIRCQLAFNKTIIKGDVKYGARRPNRDKSICLHARTLSFEHPVNKETIYIKAPVKNLKENIWKSL